MLFQQHFNECVQSTLMDFHEGITIWMWRSVFTATDPETVNVSELHYVLKLYDQHDEQWHTKTCATG